MDAGLAELTDRSLDRDGPGDEIAGLNRYPDERARSRVGGRPVSHSPAPTGAGDVTQPREPGAVDLVADSGSLNHRRLPRLPAAGGRSGRGSRSGHRPAAARPAISGVVSPVSTSAESMPAAAAMAMSVESRSPIITQRSADRPSIPSTVSSISAPGLPRFASHVTPVHASMAATIAGGVGLAAPAGHGAVAVRVGRDQPGALVEPQRVEGDLQLAVLEGAVVARDDDVDLLGVLGEPDARPPSAPA